MREQINKVKSWKQFLNENNLMIGDDVEIIDKYSSHFGEIGKFDGMVDDIDGEKAVRPYRVKFDFEGKDLIRFYRKVDIEKI